MIASTMDIFKVRMVNQLRIQNTANTKVELVCRVFYRIVFFVFLKSEVKIKPL